MADRTITVDGHEIGLSNLDKVLFPESGITKGDLIDYYARIARTALPHFRDRPVTMQRFPDGIAEDGFIQKAAPRHLPSWVERATLKTEDGTVDHVLANDAATLIALANLACVTPHLTLSRAGSIDYPDRMIFDFDPSDDDFGKVRNAAMLMKGLLDDIKLKSFVMSTGSRGVHVAVPIDGSQKFDEVRDIARGMCDVLADRHPDLMTTEQRKNKRGDRVFLDYLRNGYAQTAVAPYAVRARENAPVAVPLNWSELGNNLSPQKYTIRNVFRRLGQTDDPWRSIGRHRQSLRTAEKYRTERVHG